MKDPAHIGYMQIVKETDEQKLRGYMTLPKKQIARMLLECNKAIERMTNPQRYLVVQTSSSNTSSDWKIIKDEGTYAVGTLTPEAESKGESKEIGKGSLAKSVKRNGKMGGKKRRTH